jgi:hypothetical protein
MTRQRVLRSPFGTSLAVDRHFTKAGRAAAKGQCTVAARALSNAMLAAPRSASASRREVADGLQR